MRYTYEFKLAAVDSYKKGILVDVREGVSLANFKMQVSVWAEIVKAKGPDGLKRKAGFRYFTVDDKLKLIQDIESGKTIIDVAIEADVSYGLLGLWLKRYWLLGKIGLINNHSKPQQEKSLMKHTDDTNQAATIGKLSMEENATPSPKEQDPYEEIKRLKKENAYMKAEIDIIKNLLP